MTEWKTKFRPVATHSVYTRIITMFITWKESKSIWTQSIWRLLKALLLTKHIAAKDLHFDAHGSVRHRKLVHGTCGWGEGKGESCWSYTYFIGISIFYWSAHYVEWWPGWRFNQAPFSSLIRLVMTRSSLDIETQVDTVWPPGTTANWHRGRAIPVSLLMVG